MGCMGETTEINLDDALAEKLEQFYPEDSKESTKPEENDQDSEETEDNTVADEQADTDEETTAPEPESDEPNEESKEDTGEEEQKNIETEKPEANIDVHLQGYKKEFRELVKSIEDKDLQKNLIKTSKAHLVDLDRQREDLGENKKLINILDEAVKTNGLSYNKKGYANLVQNYLGFDALFSKDPKLAIKNLAESANIKLDDLIEKKQFVEDDYRTPEEIAQDERVAKLEEKVKRFERHNIQQGEVSAKQEVQQFADTKDAEGNLRYPHFEKVRRDMGLFFNDNYPEMTMDKAYNKAILLDDELSSQRDMNILRNAEEKRKKEIVKAKGLKKQSVKSSKISTRTNNPDANMANIVSSLGF